jgi:hypothetical protein
MASKGAGGDKTPIRTYVPVGVTEISSGGGTHGGARFPMYNIDGNNYMKLREIASRINFGVTWDGANNTIAIDTSVGYTPE